MSEEPSTYEPREIRKEDLRDTLISDPKLFAEKILKSEAVTCSITLPVQGHTVNGTECVTTTVPFYMSTDFNLGTLSNSWSDLVDMNGGNAFTNLINGINAFSENAQVTMQSEAMSSKVWKGSKFDGFSVDCLFVSTRRTLNPTKIIRLLASAALPDKLRENEQTTAQSMTTVKAGLNKAVGGIAGLVNLAADGVKGINKDIDVSGFKDAVSGTATSVQKLVNDVGMIAPLYYGVKTGKNPSDRPIAPLANTTLTLQIGDWFRADELLVESVSGITFSKEVIAPPAYRENDIRTMFLYQNNPDGADYGYPLWGKCSLRLIPFSMMHKTKFESYFIDKTADSPIDNLLGGLINNDVVNFAKSTVERFNLP